MADDLRRHQEALDAVSAFAAQLHERMQTGMDKQAATGSPEVLQACGQVAGVPFITALDGLFSIYFP